MKKILRLVTTVCGLALLQNAEAYKANTTTAISACNKWKAGAEGYITPFTVTYRPTYWENFRSTGSRLQEAVEFRKGTDFNQVADILNWVYRNHLSHANAGPSHFNIDVSQFTFNKNANHYYMTVRSPDESGASVTLVKFVTNNTLVLCQYRHSLVKFYN